MVARPIPGLPAAFLALSVAAACGSSRRSTDHSPGSGATAREDSNAGAPSAAGGRAPAEGGSRSDAGEDGAAASAGGGSGSSSGECREIPTTSQLPRLSNEQYDNTIRDLLGVATLTAHGGVPPSALLVTDFTGDMTELAWQAYRTAGEAIAVQVMADPLLKTRFLACTPEGDGKACLHDTIVEFGRRAFRRPLTAQEIDRFEAIVAQGAAITETGSPEEIAEVLLNTFLVSPSFLQRTELAGDRDESGRYTLSSYEVASRLSYLLWRTIPDDVLNRAADADALRSLEQVLVEARRMLADPRAERAVTTFHRHYLGMQGGWYGATGQKDPEKFPAFGAATVPAMRAETQKFFETVVLRDRGSFRDLLTSPIGFVNAALAPLYGLDAAAYDEDLVEVVLDADQRPGFLTRVDFLASHAGYDRSSPTLRGAFIMTHVLDLEVVPPTNIPPPVLTPEPTEPKTNRETLEELTAAPDCAGCHDSIDPPGFVLEQYDAVGGWQTVDPSGLPLDTVADVLIDGEPATIGTPGELMRAIAASAEAQRKYAEQWVAFGYERSPNELDACWVERLALRLAEPDYPVVDLIAELTLAPSFRLRARDE